MAGNRDNHANNEHDLPHEEDVSGSLSSIGLYGDRNDNSASTSGCTSIDSSAMLDQSSVHEPDTGSETDTVLPYHLVILHNDHHPLGTCHACVDTQGLREHLHRRGELEAIRALGAFEHGWRYHMPTEEAAAPLPLLTAQRMAPDEKLVDEPAWGNSDHADMERPVHYYETDSQLTGEDSWLMVPSVTSSPEHSTSELTASFILGQIGAAFLDVE